MELSWLAFLYDFSISLISSHGLDFVLGSLCVSYPGNLVWPEFHRIMVLINSKSTSWMYVFLGLGLNLRNFLTSWATSFENLSTVDSFLIGPTTRTVSKEVPVGDWPDNTTSYPDLIFFWISRVSKYSDLSGEASLRLPLLILIIAISGSQSTHTQRSGIRAPEFRSPTFFVPNPPTIPWYTSEECMFLSQTTTEPLLSLGSIQFKP